MSNQDVKTDVLESKSKTSYVRNLLQRFTFYAPESKLPGYDEIDRTIVDSVTIPEFTLSYLDDYKQQLINNDVEKVLQLSDLYDNKPELLMYEEYGNEVEYLFEFMYLNNIFSRVDFTTDETQYVMLFNRTVIDDLKNKRYDSLDKDTKILKSYTNNLQQISATDTTDVNRAVSDDSLYYLNYKDVVIDDSIFFAFVKKMGVDFYETMRRNLSVQSLVDKLVDTVGKENVIRYLSSVHLFKRREKK